MVAKDNAFSWRLRCAIQATQKTQKEICTEIGISAPTLSQYLAGNREPSIVTVAALAKALQVSTDYLLGLSSVTNPSVDHDDMITNYGFRDSTIQFFNELQRNWGDGEGVDEYGGGIPDEYKQYIDPADWRYVREANPTVDAQSFFYDVLEHPKMSDVASYVFYYQIARSYLRIFKDRRDAYCDDLNDEEKEYASCQWDSLHERIQQYEKMSEEERSRYKLYQLAEDQRNYYVSGIPSTYADKAMIYRELIKKTLCQIIDDCCDKFELSHNQHFHQEKERFIANMKYKSMLHKKYDLRK